MHHGDSEQKVMKLLVYKLLGQLLITDDHRTTATNKRTRAQLDSPGKIVTDLIHSGPTKVSSPLAVALIQLQQSMHNGFLPLWSD